MELASTGKDWALKKVVDDYCGLWANPGQRRACELQNRRRELELEEYGAPFPPSEDQERLLLVESPQPAPSIRQP
jgi:hypothetical protein